MTSLDTNLLFFAFAADRPEHRQAVAFFDSLADREDIVLSELMLAELYRLLRNPVVLARPLSAPDAAEVIQTWRSHPRWRLTGFPPDGARLHEELWKAAAQPGFAYRRLYDLRLALTLLQHGVTEFATVNTRDFERCGFARLWNPLEG